MSSQDNQVYIQELQQSVQQLQSLTQTQHPFDTEVQRIITETQNLISSSGAMLNNNDVEHNQLHQLRASVTDMRVTLQNFRDDIRNREDQVIQTYRATLGETKSSFESLATDKQYGENPQAFQSLQEYKAIEQLDDTLGKINGNLMDVSHQLESHYNTQHPPAPFDLEEKLEHGPDPKYQSP
jgi:uncharacterized protein YoxC